jgi:PQQ enzyme repeat
MLRAIKECLLGAALLCSLGLSSEAQTPATPPPQNNLLAPPTPSATPQTVKNFVPVTDQTLRPPKPEGWLMLRGNYQGWGYSPLDQINKTNVKNLQLVRARVMEPGINEAAPIVYNGVMYLGNPADVIQAIDAVTGDLLWEFRHAMLLTYCLVYELLQLIKPARRKVHASITCSPRYIHYTVKLDRRHIWQRQRQNTKISDRMPHLVAAISHFYQCLTYV